MPLQITTTKAAAQDVVSSLIMGIPKIGKTSLILTLTLSKDSDLLYVAADPGQLVLRERDFSLARPDKGQPVDISFLEDVYKHAYQGAAKGHYKWIVTDGVDVISRKVLQAKMKGTPNGLKAYGEMAEYMEDWLSRMRDIGGASNLFITHIDTIGQGDDVRFIPTVPGQQLKEKINCWFDLIGAYRFIKTGENTTERAIQFYPDPDPRYQVGDRSGALDHFEKPNLQTIYNKIHNKGLLTESEVVPMKFERSVTDMKQLHDIMIKAKLSVQDIGALAKEYCNGATPKFMTDEEYETLVNKVKERIP